MGDRTVDLDPNATCDNCGARGAYDFYGDLICPGCIEMIPEDEFVLLDDDGNPIGDE